MIGSEDTQRADPHQGAVGLAVRIGPASETAVDGAAAVEGSGLQPEDVSLTGSLGIVASLLRQHPGQQQRHFGIVGGLSGAGVPGPAVGQLPDAAGVLHADFLRSPEFHQAAEGVSGELAQQASPGPGEGAGVYGFSVGFGHLVCVNITRRFG